MLGQSRANHKYIRKYRGRNGKWVYVYADNKTHTSINRSMVTSGNLASDAKRYNSLGDMSSKWAREARANGDSTAALQRGRDATEMYYRGAQASVEATKAADEAMSKIASNSVKSISKKKIKSVQVAIKDPSYVKRYKDSSGKTQYVYAKKETHEKIATKQKEAARDTRMSRDSTKQAQDIYKYDLRSSAQSTEGKAIARSKAVAATKNATEKRNSAAAKNAVADALINGSSVNTKLSAAKKRTVSKAKKFVSKSLGR